MNKPRRQTADEIEEKPAPQDAAPVSGADDSGEEQRKTTSLLEMLFREAEVIAKNLKESGTRR